MYIDISYTKPSGAYHLGGHSAPARIISGFLEIGRFVFVNALYEQEIFTKVLRMGNIF